LICRDAAGAGSTAGCFGLFRRLGALARLRFAPSEIGLERRREAIAAPRRRAAG